VPHRDVRPAAGFRLDSNQFLMDSHPEEARASSAPVRNPALIPPLDELAQMLCAAKRPVILTEE